MEYLLKILDNAIPGVIYCSAIIFFFLSIIGLTQNNPKVNVEFSKLNHRNFVLYYLVIFVFISHIISGVADVIVGHLVAWKLKNLDSYILDQIVASKKNEIIALRNNYYGLLIFFRHLILSMSLLFLALVFWMRNKRYVIIIFLVTILFVVFSYLYIQHDLLLIKNDIHARFAP